MLGENKAERGNRRDGADIFEWMTRGCPGNDPLEKRTERYEGEACECAEEELARQRGKCKGSEAGVCLRSSSEQHG